MTDSGSTWKLCEGGKVGETSENVLIKVKTGGPLSRLQGSHSLEKSLNLRGSS